ncbi:protein phosphatase 2c domain-containing protein [Cystoisospora suis]|uniref:Protein phosphatase 2c domain-containing protein n=1 Tax=Cystoisospora suis TaxID=483139 RepID=A0A2C6L945_9APIC|nr:protein phosphatase 2c domain-containing protein [Cystoisospora suis]
MLSAPRGFSALTVDHKPASDKEKKRIRDAYGDVVPASGSLRINGVLNVSRAFGDFFLKDIWWRSAEKQKVICVPDVRRFVAVPGDILLISSDGIFGEDTRSREAVMDIVRDKANAGATLQQIALAVVQRASWDSGDNISVILSLFQGVPQQQAEVLEVVSSSRGKCIRYITLKIQLFFGIYGGCPGTSP